MNLITITEVSKSFNISTRTLRYYEQIGLLKSTKKDEYAYRTYDDEAILRLQQIIVLRKLRIPLKQIITILESDSTEEIIETFRKNLSEVNDEITALSTIRAILNTFITRLNANTHLDLKINLLDDIAILDVVDSLTMTKIAFKEEKTMEDLNKANEKMSKLTDKDVRIIYLPPSAVASYQYIGNDPEMHVNEVIDKFVRDNDLIHIKPDLRHYGFNAPNPDETGYHGYEIWITISDNMDVPEPLIKKHFDGGLYAAHMIPFGAFEEWDWLGEWVKKSEKYEYRGNWNMDNMFGWLEEHLNYVNHVNIENSEPQGMQLDLLVPIKEK